MYIHVQLGLKARKYQLYLAYWHKVLISNYNHSFYLSRRKLPHSHSKSHSDSYSAQCQSRVAILNFNINHPLLYRSCFNFGSERDKLMRGQLHIMIC